MKVYGYKRVSGKGQLTGDGFTRQGIAIEKFAKANGHTLVKVFSEKAVPGATDMVDRPAWREMIAEAVEGGAEAIVIERLDRLARDLMVQEYIVADIIKRGLVLLSTAEPDLCSTDPTRVLIRQILGAVAAYDKAMIVLKLRGARERKRESGRCEGIKPYGMLDGEPDFRARGSMTPDDAQGRGPAITNKLRRDENQIRYPSMREVAESLGNAPIPQLIERVMEEHYPEMLRSEEHTSE